MCEHTNARKGSDLSGAALPSPPLHSSSVGLDGSTVVSCSLPMPCIPRTVTAPLGMGTAWDPPRPSRSTHGAGEGSGSPWGSLPPPRRASQQTALARGVPGCRARLHPGSPSSRDERPRAR